MAGPRIGSSGGRSLTAAIASAGGGSSSLGVRGLAVIGGVGRGIEGGSNAPIQARLFATERGNRFKAFLNSTKGSDTRSATPAPIYQPFTSTEVASLKASVRPVEMPVRTEAPTNIIPFPLLKAEPTKKEVEAKNTSKGEIWFSPTAKPAERTQTTISEPVKPQAEIGAIKIVGTAERTGLTLFEQRAVLSKIQANLKFIRGLRSQLQPEVGLNTATEIAPQQANGLATETSIVTPTSAQPEAKTTRPNHNSRTEVPGAEGLSDINRSRRQRLVLQPLKFIVDEIANNARIEALLLAQRSLEAKSQDQSFSNEAVVQESGISYDEKFGSNALRKAGIRRLDGSQPRTGRDVAAVFGRLNREKLKEIVYDHTAIDYGEGSTVGRKAIYEVSTLPEELAPSVDLEKTLPVKSAVKIVEGLEMVTASTTSQVAEEPKQVTEVVSDLAFEAIGRNLDFVGSSLDRVLHNDNVILFSRAGRIDETEERNQLVAA